MLRPELVAPRRRRLAVVGVGLSLLLVAPIVAVGLVPHAPALAPIVHVAAPAVPAPIVHVAPAVINLPAPAPPPAPPPPVIAAAAPHLPPAWCLTLAPDTPVPARCTWDRGFPAISADAALVATLYERPDGGRGAPNLELHILDSATSKLVDSIVILSVDESDSDPAKLTSRIARRLVGAQRLLDGHGYRSMETLPATSDDNPRDDLATVVHAEIADDAVRIVDPALSRALWQHEFVPGAPSPRRQRDPDEECGSWGLHHTDLAWDRATGVVLATQLVHTGGCMCPSALLEQVARMR